ncbi:MAG: ABC transporter permease [Actinomycetota bacterium]|nr:ABC transporter permease [Actinomycetota bacterium]
MTFDPSERDAEILETKDTDFVTAFEGDTPAGTRTPSALRHRVKNLIPAGISFLVVMALWEGAIRVFDVEAFILPAPSLIIERFIATSDVVWGAGWNTFLEAAGGLIGGTMLGVGVAFATIRWAPVREGLMPVAVAANSVPIIALAPIANGMFSITSPVPKMAVVGVVVFFPVMINTTRGLLEVDADELELMRSYAATPREVMRRVRVPHALPYFFSAMKVVAVLSIVFAIVAEYFGGSQDVLGQYILNKASLFVFPDAWAGILVASILGVVLYAAVLLAERLVMPWHVSFRAVDAS